MVKDQGLRVVRAEKRTQELRAKNELKNGQGKMENM